MQEKTKKYACCNSYGNITEWTNESEFISQIKEDVHYALIRGMNVDISVGYDADANEIKSLTTFS